MTKTPMNEAKIMPPNTGVPTSRRASCEAPTATTRGSRPRMKANDVIITGRKRCLAPSVAASSNGTPCSRFSFANSTIKMPFLAASPISTMMPICAYRSSVSPASTIAANDPRMPTEPDSSTGTGRKCARGYLFHGLERLPGRDARRGRALNGYGAQIVVADQRWRADHDANFHQTPERDHLSFAIADIDPIDVVDTGPVGRLGL